MKQGSNASEGLETERHEPRGRIMRLAHYFLRIVGLALLAAFVALGGGFLIFIENVASMRPPDDPKADAIVALTGGYQRIDIAVKLLGDGVGERLLISGVHPSTTGNQIRLLTRSSAGLFECCVDIGHDALDTAGNAQETARWIKMHGFRQVILVTNNYHMPRSLAELRRADSHTEFIPYPVENGMTLEDIGRNPLLVRTLASEYVKFLLVQSRDWTGIRL